LLAELAGTAGNGTMAERLVSLEAALRPTYRAVPKESDGTLSHNVVRYVLQRFFARRNGWFIRGLEPNNGSAMATANASIAPQLAFQAMQEWAPGYLQTFLEKIMAGRGVSLRELAVFAATLEDLIHKEEQGHLLQAYTSFDQPTSIHLKPDVAYNVLQTYMMIYMLGGNWTQQLASQVDRLGMLFSKKVSHWDETLSWLKQLLADNAKSTPDPDNGLDFNSALQMVSQIGNRFATFNTGECGRLKSQLKSQESAKPGRVRLVDFYKMGLQGAWEFNEKLAFLRDTGMLDESDPSTPLVIMPNYVQARTNCLAVSSFYAVCCPNECEDLMQGLEAEIAGSTARPARIAKIVAKLSSATSKGPRVLAKPLMQRLQDIAGHHRGEIPLHGRLFAQWMHHAFPRECPYPHAGGTATAQTADEWMLQTGQADSTLSKEEMLTEIASDTCKLLPQGVKCEHRDHKESAPATFSDQDEELPWDLSEELLVVHEKPPVHPVVGVFNQFATLRPLHDIMTWCALATLIYGLVWAMKKTVLGRRISLWAGVPDTKSQLDKC